MELRQYLQVVLRAWWIIIPLTLASLTLSLVFSYTRIPTFEATSQYVIAFGGSAASIDRADQYYIIETLVGRQQIPVTACSAITSGDNFGAALAQLGITEQMVIDEVFDPSKYNVSCNVLPESSVLLLIVQGPSPRVVEGLNATLGLLGTSSVEGIYNGLITLEIIDRPYLEPEPVAPDHTQNAVLGTALGIVLSLTLALLQDYFRSPLEKMEGAAIRDPLTNAYNERYFNKRLEEEVERSRQRNRPLSVGLLELKTNEDYSLMPQNLRDEFLHQASLYIQDKLQHGDIVAYRGELQFIILLPETPGYEARSRLLVVHSALRSHLFRNEQFTTSFTSKIGIVESVGDALGQVDLVSQADVALERAEHNRTRHIYLMSTQSSAFVLDSGDEDDLQAMLPEDELIDRVTADVGKQRQNRGLGRLFGSSAEGKPEPRTPSEAQSTPFAGTDFTDNDTEEFDVERKLNLQSTLPDDDPLLNETLDQYSPSTTVPDDTLPPPGSRSKPKKPDSKPQAKRDSRLDSANGTWQRRRSNQRSSNQED